MATVTLTILLYWITNVRLARSLVPRYLPQNEMHRRGCAGENGCRTICMPSRVFAEGRQTPAIWEINSGFQFSTTQNYGKTFRMHWPKDYPRLTSPHPTLPTTLIPTYLDLKRG